MAGGNSQQIVIDASVARAAGPENAVHPTSKHCRDFLLRVLEVCHRAVFSPQVSDEWRVHQSGFARQWRRSMFARKKVDVIGNPENPSLRQQLEQAAGSEKQQEALAKDVHLVEAALVTGMRIAALDETVHSYLSGCSAAVAAIRPLCWVNPSRPEEDALGWLSAGAPAQPTRMLGAERPDE